VINKGEQNFIK